MKLSECPKCKSQKVVEIVYGLPSPESKAYNREDIYFAGCCVEDENWHCKDCKHEWK